MNQSRLALNVQTPVVIPAGAHGEDEAERGPPGMPVTHSMTAPAAQMTAMTPYVARR
jgi:hypothetical protein